ncbi:MAG: tRNA (adenosine(37)-N6)-threonylcarbamoyltransferase complex transferase subunit TsaD [Bacteroidetes bacterium HGW-Bacteroidetes-5]|jgi:N6-L-threonylcarbamoyladenine synthase|nr:MAG: tRNA (adenosine(37)-N6)-threonylcarbamoyltransferase complex transferase subunit TsaD [Bacteroidetes bacterium HGW-Bacteroidetes-5]
MSTLILAIESSCDDTSASVVSDGIILSNVMASQDVHQKYGGVIPELASRAHLQNIVPVVYQALKDAGKDIKEIEAIVFTRGPGLLGSLLVGTSFAKGLALSLNIPLVDVNHLQGHLLSHFINEPGSVRRQPSFPFLSLLVSGGHTQIVRVDDYLRFEVIGETIDDAVGEAFDKCAKIMDLGYPGGPVVDRLAKEGNPFKFKFSKPRIAAYNFSFSGVKTSLLYFLRDSMKDNPRFIEENLNDLCASFQKSLIDILMDKLIKASQETGIKEIALAGGVSANSALRERVVSEGQKRGWNTYIPENRFTTDNAAMIAVAGYYRYLSGHRAQMDTTPVSRAINYI